jgi:hypothetical protein
MPSQGTGDVEIVVNSGLRDTSVSLIRETSDIVKVAVIPKAAGGAWAMAVVFSAGAAVTNSAANVARRVKLYAARANQQCLSFIAVVGVGFSVEMSAANLQR